VNEIKIHYINVNRIEREAYERALFLARVIPYEMWREMLHTLSIVIKKKVEEKKDVLKKKCSELLRKKGIRENSAVNNNSFIINKSSVVFSEKEKEMLSKGLKMQPMQSVPPVNDIIVSVETSIKNLPFERKASIRKEIGEILEQKHTMKFSREQLKIIHELKQKDVMYLEPDKGKGIVVVDKEKYKEAALEHLSSDSYSKATSRAKFPVDTIQRHLKSELKELQDFGLINEWQREKLILSNPVIPHISFLPKIHKEGNKMRPVVSGINAPTSRICNLLMSKVKKFKKPWALNIKNSQEFVKCVEKLHIGDDEIMVSFDIVQLFPSIPLEEAFTVFCEWVEEQEDTENEKSLCIQLMRIILDQRWLQFDGMLYKQEKGLFIGSSVSPLLTEIFMGCLEKKMSVLPWFPSVWHRYVDDVFSIIKRGDERILEKLNEQHGAITFTMEKEESESINFLDLKLHRENGRVTIDIYRKPTDAPLMIHNASNHHPLHKNAAIEAAVHRLCTLPLNKERHKKELEYIGDMAMRNGYKKEIVASIYKKHKNKMDLRNITTLRPINDDSKRKLKKSKDFMGKEITPFVVLPFYKSVTGRIEKVLRRNGINVVYNNKNTLRTMIGVTKKKTTTRTLWDI
jgi:hypothetical protein